MQRRRRKYSFIDKEKDAETGLSNFGVRNYDDGLGRFMSVDVLWEKYRSLTPYQYSANNPLRLKDANGQEFTFENSESRDAYTKLYGALKKEHQAVLDRLAKSDMIYHINMNAQTGTELGSDNTNGQAYFDFNDNRFEVQVRQGVDNPLAVLGEELTHANQFEIGKVGFVKNNQPWGSAIGYDAEDEVDSKRGYITASQAVNSNTPIPSYIQQAVNGAGRSSVDNTSSGNVLSNVGYHFSRGGEVMGVYIPAHANMSQTQLQQNYPQGFIYRQRNSETGRYDTVR